MLEAGGGEVEYNLETDKTFSATLSLIRLKRIQYNTISFKINVADILKTIILVKPVVSIVIYTRAYNYDDKLGFCFLQK